MPSSPKKWTAATKQQELTHVPPSGNSPAMPTPAPAPQPTASIPATPAPPASSPPLYKPIMDDASTECLVGLAKDSPPDSALGIVWRYAFEEGKQIGYSEGTQMVDGIDINEVLRTGVEKGIEKGIERGIEIGRDREKHTWGAAGHSTTCITVARPPRGVAVQTDRHLVPWQRRQSKLLRNPHHLCTLQFRLMYHGPSPSEFKTPAHKPHHHHPHPSTGQTMPHYSQFFPGVHHLVIYRLFAQWNETLSVPPTPLQTIPWPNAPFPISEHLLCSALTVQLLPTFIFHSLKDSLTFNSRSDARLGSRSLLI